MNEDAEGTWFFRMTPADPGEADGFLDEAAYAALIGA